MTLTQLLRRPDPLIIGILNTTPDSFSDGGLFHDLQSAVRHGLDMANQGADIIDIGGESTRPGAVPVSIEEQLARVVPVIEALRAKLPDNVRLSIDTSQSAVAAAALDAGAAIINDVRAGRDDPAILALAAERGAPIVLMHMLGTPLTMQDHPRYGNVVEEVAKFLLERAAAAQAAGVPKQNIILDPGIGFGKRKEDNLALMANLPRFVSLGYPTMLGTSRKRFMGTICNETRPHELVAATVATTTLGVMAGITLYRVHDVRENRQAADVAYAIKLAGAAKRSEYHMP